MIVGGTTGQVVLDLCGGYGVTAVAGSEFDLTCGSLTLTAVGSALTIVPPGDGVLSIEIPAWTTARITTVVNYDFTIEDGRLHLQRFECGGNACETFGPVEPAAREQLDHTSRNARLNTISVELDLVRPIRPRRGCIRQLRQAWLDERGQCDGSASLSRSAHRAEPINLRMAGMSGCSDFA